MISLGGAGKSLQYSWSVTDGRTLTNLDDTLTQNDIALDEKALHVSNALVSSHSVLWVSLTVTNWFGSRNTTSITVIIANNSYAPTVYVDGGIYHYHVLYPERKDIDFASLSVQVSFSSCDQTVSNNIDVPRISWQSITWDVIPSDRQWKNDKFGQGEALNLHSLNVTTTNVTTLFVPAGELDYATSYVFAVTATHPKNQSISTTEYMSLTILPPPVTYAGGIQYSGVYFNSNITLSARSIFNFPAYVTNENVAEYYNIKWNCTSVDWRSVHHYCEDIVAGQEDQLDNLIEAGLLDGGSNYTYTVTVWDKQYDMTTTGTMLLSLTPYVEVLHGGIQFEAPNALAIPAINAIHDRTRVELSNVLWNNGADNVNFKTSSSQCASLINYVDQTNNKAYISMATNDWAECPLSYGSFNTITYWNLVRPNAYFPFVITASVNVLVNIPPLGGQCSLVATGSSASPPYVAFVSQFAVSCDDWSVAYVDENRYWYDNPYTAYVEYSVWVVSSQASPQCALLWNSTTNTSISNEAILSTCEATKVVDWTLANSDLEFVLGAGKFYRLYKSETSLPKPRPCII
ncbi:hypothetical protein RFI_05765 [Reticulomyxa filosa]|uniref:Uncharacterized protein n=1 Tax=Reticulomyxa filosa TaxID=46433 RepID=X6NZU0_RETFI|nr:hypothetical protein RFI_05765 [Reticulomyxa filosa]|eukprot:ETO31354.1 hypothetical protein RFI_05765 [Reticulomyxa filosa]